MMKSQYFQHERNHDAKRCSVDQHFIKWIAKQANELSDLNRYESQRRHGSGNTASVPKSADLRSRLTH
jgi:hypothetical protein